MSEINKTKKLGRIKNMDDLRNEVLEVFEGLRDNTVSVAEAGAIAKLSETVISNVKAQMEYSRLTNTAPVIPFISDAQPRIVATQPIKIEPTHNNMPDAPSDLDDNE